MMALSLEATFRYRAGVALFAASRLVDSRDQLRDHLLLDGEVLAVSACIDATLRRRSPDDRRLAVAAILVDRPLEAGVAIAQMLQATKAGTALASGGAGDARVARGQVVHVSVHIAGFCVYECCFAYQHC